MLIDTHAHINLSAYRDDGDAVIRRSLEENVWLVNVGCDYKSSKRALDYANRYEKGVYAAIGLQPSNATETIEDGVRQPGEEFNYDLFEKLAKFEKVAAIGEIGLDYYHLDPAGDALQIKAKQKEVFLAQLELAARLDLPVIIHCRQAHDDMTASLREFRKEHKDVLPKNRPWAVIHCFSGDENLAWEYFSLGATVSFTGLITFSKQWDDLIRKLPLEKFMIETDCPYLTPEPYRGKRNEPVMVGFVAERIAAIKNLPLERIAEATTRNAREFFRI